MQLLVNSASVSGQQTQSWKRLELSADTELAFTARNILFAFDNIECERTQEFTIPATMYNERVLFEFAGEPYFRGQSMRVRLDAEVQDAGRAYGGILYVDRYEKGNYIAVLIVGDYIALKRLSELGKIADVVECPEVAVVRASGDGISADTTGNDIWQSAAYAGYRVNPSISIRWLLDRIAASTGVDIQHGITTNERIISTAEPMQAETLRFVRVPKEGSRWKPYNEDLDVLDNMYVQGGSLVQNLFRSDVTGSLYARFQSRDLYGYVEQFVCVQNMTITFGGEFPDDVYMIQLNGMQLTWYGGRSFDKLQGGQVVRTGEPLRGRSVEINRGDKFVFVKEDDMLTPTTTDGGWYPFLLDRLTVEVIVEGRDVGVGDAVRLQDNLPDMTVIDFVKAIAYMNGASINYDRNTNTIVFDKLEDMSGREIDLSDRIIDFGTLRRTFSDFAQISSIVYDSDSNIPESERVSSDYLVGNANIEPHKDLAKIPFSEGRDAGGGLVGVYEGTKKQTVGFQERAGETYLRRTESRLNTSIATLCYASTTVEVTAFLERWEIDRITPKTTFLIRGVRYVWTNIEYSGRNARLTLAVFPWIVDSDMAQEM